MSLLVHGAVRAPVSVRPRPPSPALPHDVAFLADYGVPAPALLAAVRASRALGVPAWRALIASGAVSETLYALALTRHLDLPLVESWPTFAEPFDPVAALRRGWAKLSTPDGPVWLVVPTEEVVDLLIATRRRAGLAMPAIAIATPGHFCTLVRQRGRHALVRSASLHLPDHAPHLSAKGATHAASGVVPAIVAGLCVGGVVLGSSFAADAVGALFLAAMVFRLLVCAAGLRPAPPAPPACADAALPRYSVVVALYREAEIVPRLVASLAALDYPPAKLEVLFLIEQSDGVTRTALRAAHLPPNFRIVVVPAGEPQTKPRALNVGLMVAKGELLTVFDAEDCPEPDQLRKAADLFAVSEPDVACLQARLAIGNAAEGALPSLFAIEYAALFDLFNVGLARWRLPMALGGTSNHFRTRVLREVGGWDAWNVTEDADLGLRLSRWGYRVEALASTTWESALPKLAPWLKQRRRWIKGWMQTALVLGRDPRVVRELGVARSLAVALMLTTLVVGPLLTPFALVFVTWRLARYGVPAPQGAGETIQATLAWTVAALGVFQPLWCALTGAKLRGIAAVRRLPLLLPYILLVSVAAWLALRDLIRAPYHWHKTDHAHAAGDAAPARAVAFSRSSP